MKKHAIALLVAAAGTSAAFAAPVDLSTWTSEGPGTWNVAADNNSVLQTVNGSPTVFYSAGNEQGKQLSGKIKVETTGDDDYIGFVLGYQAGDAASSSTYFILIDWKQANQGSYGCTAFAGLSISHVSGGLPEAAASWCHNGTTTELARGLNLGSTGWSDNTEYAFDLIFTASNIQVFVDGVKELDINGSFADGAFGFYNYSQSTVRYSAIEEAAAPPPNGNPMPEPTSMLLVGAALAAMGVTRRRK